MGTSKSLPPSLSPLAAEAVPGPHDAVQDQARSIADALFTTTQQRVLGLLFGQPERSFFTKELIALAGAGSGAVQRELHRLIESGLIQQKAVGNQKHYQANPEAPIFDELRSIVSKTIGVATVLREALDGLSGRLQLALLYGSTARGSAAAHSDIDLLLLSDSLTLEEVYSALEPAESRLGRPINPTLYSSSEFRQRLADRNPFLSKLLAGKTVTLLGAKDAFVAA